MINGPARPDYDVVVAGARCAGAATAMLLARQGLRVLVVDPVPRGRDTLSTHALMRGGVLQLHRWGLLDAVRASGAPAVSRTVFDYGDEIVDVPIKEKNGVDALFAPRRTVLDPIVVDAAREAGAEVVYGLSLVDLVADSAGRVRGAWLNGREGGSYFVSARLVVGADGVRSRVARLVNAPVVHRAESATASIYGYWKGLERDAYRWYFRPGVGIGTIPTNDGNACVFTSVRPEALKEGRSTLAPLFHEAVRSVDVELASRLTPEAQSGTLRAFAGERGFLRKATGPGWALVGDAGYFKDPLTAHGITDAFRDAELLARAVVSGDAGELADYESQRNGAARGLMAVTDRIASLEWSMEEVKALHHTLSREMNVSLGVVDSWEPLAQLGVGLYT